MALLREDKISPELNKTSTQRRFFRSPSTKSSGMGADLDGLNTKFLPAGSNAFLT